MLQAWLLLGLTLPQLVASSRPASVSLSQPNEQKRTRSVRIVSPEAPVVRVMVPEGVTSGDTIMVTHEGRSFPVEVPDGVESGQDLDVTLPAEQFVQVAVPPGLHSGDEFTVEYEGQTFEVILPDGAEEGQLLEIDLRLNEPDELGEAPERPLGEAPERLDPIPLPTDGDDLCIPKAICSMRPQKASQMPEKVKKFYIHQQGFNKGKPKNPKPDCNGRCPECPLFDAYCVRVADVAALSEKIDQEHALEAQARMRSNMPDSVSQRKIRTMELADGTVIDDVVGTERARRISAKREAKFPRKILMLDNAKGYVDDTTVTRADWKEWDQSCRGRRPGDKVKMHVADGYRMVECGDVLNAEYKLGPKV